MRMVNARYILVTLGNDGTLSVPDGSSRILPIRLRPMPAERGAVAIIFAFSLIVMIGIFGLAVDLSRLYNRRVEMQNVADAVALAAARQLNGTPSGIDSAVEVAGLAAAKFKYNYNVSTIAWSNAAIQFSATPSLKGTWLNAGSAKASPQQLLYVKVDTKDLAPNPGSISTTFIRVLPSAHATVSTSGRAIAGPSMIKVTPFAICAMSPLRAEPRANPGSALPTVALPNVELVEYGFRRGVGYDLMQLNPDDDTTRANFLVNPMAPPGKTGSSADMTDDAVTPFLCAGTMAMSRVTGGQITVSRPFPINTLFDRFNSRFDIYLTGKCDAWAAPPDSNVKPYNRTVSSSIPWMSAAAASAPGSQGALLIAANKKVRTVADPLPAPPTNTAPNYGVLWSFAKAVPFDAYTDGVPEPSGGYATFPASAWSTLYDPGRPAVTATTYHDGTITPYTGSVSEVAPRVANRPGIPKRRVLNVPLLACPVTGSSATVLAIGKFFMTMPATISSLPTEFAGLAPEESLGTKVELYP
jgi:Flp pilus assembly protein TadG